MGGNDNATLALSVIGTVVVLFTVHTVWQWRRLSHIPGPFVASVFKGYMMKEALKARQPNWFKALNEEYGKLCACLPSPS
jgi:hypothetical protein